MDEDYQLRLLVAFDCRVSALFGRLHHFDHLPERPEQRRSSAGTDDGYQPQQQNSGRELRGSHQQRLQGAREAMFSSMRMMIIM